MSAGRHAAYVAAAAAGYAALTVWLTWPLAATLTTRLPCTQPLACTATGTSVPVGFDTFYSAWAVSWVSHALTTAPLDVGAANIYHPAPDALYYGPAAFGAVPYALPVFVATGNAAAASNIAFLSCIALTALALHWVVWRWTGDTLGGFVAAWAFLMNRWFLWGFVGTTPHLAAIQYLPLIAFLAAAPLQSLRLALVLLLLITVQCLTDPVYVAAAVLAPVGALALLRIARRESRRAGLLLLGVLAGSLVGLVPFVDGYARVRAANPDLARQSPWADSFKPFIDFGGVIPSDLTRLLWHGTHPTTMAPAILGVIAVGGLIGIVRRGSEPRSGLGHGWRHAFLWAATGTWISLSPIATLGDVALGTRLRLPQYAFVRLGVFDVIRVPERLGVAGMVGFSLLAGVAFAELGRALAAMFDRHRARLLVALAAGTVAVLAYRIPPAGSTALPSGYPLQPAPSTDEALLHALRAGTGPVLELPALHPGTDRVEPLPNAIAMYRSTLHWRSLLNGYASYWPAGFHQRMQLGEQLPAGAALRALVCETGVQTIVVHLDGEARNRAAWLRARTTAPEGLRLAGSTPDVLVFDVTMRPPGQPGGIECGGLDDGTVGSAGTARRGRAAAS